MKVLTIVGTRPEIIRLSRIMPKLDKLCEHRILHTGQNYDPNLNDIFFSDLELRRPDVMLESKGSISEQLSSIFIGVEKELNTNRPDKVLVLGDTNSGLAAIIAERMGIPVYHMEAGNRCFDLKVPEEVNRRIIDHTASYNLPYVKGSRDNLLREGLSPNKILLTGNPIFEVLEYYKYKIGIKSPYLFDYINNNKYCLVTCHRAETVDNKEKLSNIIEALKVINNDYKIIFSCHPKTKQRLVEFKIDTGDIVITKPLGFFEFVALEKGSRLIISDSGTVLEESVIFNKPILTIRDSTERPEAVESGLNIVCGTNKDDIFSAFNIIKHTNTDAIMPEGYCNPNVSDIVINYLLGKGK